MILRMMLYWSFSLLFIGRGDEDTHAAASFIGEGELP